MTALLLAYVVTTVASAVGLLGLLAVDEWQLAKVAGRTGAAVPSPAPRASQTPVAHRQEPVPSSGTA